MEGETSRSVRVPLLSLAEPLCTFPVFLAGVGYTNIHQARDAPQDGPAHRPVSVRCCKHDVLDRLTIHDKDEEGMSESRYLYHGAVFIWP